MILSITLCVLLYMSSVLGAEDSYSEIMFFLDPMDRKPTNIIISVVLMAFGLILVGLSLRIKKLTGMISAFFLATLVTLLVFYHVRAPKEGETIRAIVYMSVSGGVGIIAALVAIADQHITAIFIGALAGKLLGPYIIMWIPTHSLEHFWARLLLNVTPTVVLGLAAMFMPRIGLIIFPPFSGSFMIFAGIDYFTKVGFTENFIQSFARNPEFVAKSTKLYIFSAAVALLFVLGTVYNALTYINQRRNAEYYEEDAKDSKNYTQYDDSSSSRF